MPIKLVKAALKNLQICRQQVQNAINQAKQSKHKEDYKWATTLTVTLSSLTATTTGVYLAHERHEENKRHKQNDHNTHELTKALKRNARALDKNTQALQKQEKQRNEFQNDPALEEIKVDKEQLKKFLERKAKHKDRCARSMLKISQFADKIAKGERLTEEEYFQKFQLEMALPSLKTGMPQNVHQLMRQLVECEKQAQAAINQMLHEKPANQAHSAEEAQQQGLKKAQRRG